MLTDQQVVATTGLDAAALKPAECDISRAAELPFETVAIDFEGREHVPDRDTLSLLAADREVRLTVPVRADGFDPLGDDELDAEIPEGVARVLVAGHPAYLSDEERDRPVAPRLGAAADRHPDAWVGTESIERLAMATGQAQFELLSRSTEREVGALRAAGYDGTVAVYAPTVLTDDPDAVLDSVGTYVARRGPVAKALPPETAADADATGRARDVLLAAAQDYALVGSPETVRSQVEDLRAAGVDRVVGYPARGLDAFLGA